MECDDNSNETTACTVAPATESALQPAPQPLTEQVAARKFDSPPTAMNAADIVSAAMQVAPSNNGAVAAATFKKENLVLESEANGYKYYKIADTMFSEDAAGNWFKLNTSRNEFEAYIWPDEIKKRQAQKKEYPYVDVDKFGRATFPVNEHGEPILPKNEAGAKVFPIDNDGKPIFPWDWANDRPTLPVNDKRRPVFPIGSHGKPIVPMDIHGYPIFPLNPDDGNYLFPEREDGRPIPPVNIFDVPVLPLDEHGNHVVPYDSKGEPLIKLGGQDGLTPMTLEEYGEWEEQCRQWMLYQQQYNPEYYQQMYGDNQALPGTPAYYAQQLRYQPENPVDQAARLEREKAEKAKKLLEWQLKSRVRKEEDKKDSDENEDKDDGSKRVIPTPTMASKPAFAKLKEQEREMRKNKEMKEKELQQQKTEVARKEDVHVQKKKSRSRSRSPVTSEKTGGAVRRVYVGGKLQQVTPVSSRPYYPPKKPPRIDYYAVSSSSCMSCCSHTHSCHRRSRSRRRSPSYSRSPSRSRSRSSSRCRSRRSSRSRSYSTRSSSRSSWENRGRRWTRSGSRRGSRGSSSRSSRTRTRSSSHSHSEASSRASHARSPWESASSRDGTPEFSAIRRGERDRSDSRSESRARRSDKKKVSKREKERRERDKKKTRSSKKRRRSRSQSSRSPSNSSRESRSRRVSKQSRRVADARARSESQELSAEELERRAREAALEALANAKKKQQKQTQEKTSAKPAPADDTEEYTVALPPHLVPSPPLEETQKHPEPEPEQPQPVVDVVQHEQTVDQPADKQDTEEEMMECQQQQSRDDGYDSEGERIMLELRERRRRKEEAELAMLEQLSQMHSQPAPASAPQETAEVDESVSSVPDSRVESSLIGGGGEDDMEQCATPEPTVEELEQKVEAMKEQMAREEERERAEAEQASRATTTSLLDQQQAVDDGFELRKSDRVLAAAPVAPADEKEDSRPAVAAFLPRKVVTAEKRERRRVESSSSPSDTDKQLEEESLSGMALLSALRKERALMEEERERSERVLSELRETRKRRAEAGGDEPVRQRPAGELIGQLQHLVDGNDKAQALLQQLMRTMNQKTNGF